MSCSTNPTNRRQIQKLAQALAVAALLVAGLAALGSSPSSTAPSSPPQAEMQFVDLQGFDRDLYSSLSAPLPRMAKETARI